MPPRPILVSADSPSLPRSLFCFQASEARRGGEEAIAVKFSGGKAPRGQLSAPSHVRRSHRQRERVNRRGEAPPQPPVLTPTPNSPRHSRSPAAPPPPIPLLGSSSPNAVYGKRHGGLRRVP